MEHFNIKRLICYSDVFKKDIKTVNRVELAQSIPTFSAISWGAYILVRRQSLRIGQSDMDILAPLMFKLDKDTCHFIVNYLQRYDLSSIILLDEYALVALIDFLLDNNNFGYNKDHELTKIDFGNLFKLILCFNEERALNASNMQELKGLDEMLRYYLPNQMKLNNVIFPDDFRVDFIKFCMFEEFCKENKEYKALLKNFMKYYRIDRWDKYLLNIIDVYTRLEVDSQNGPTCIINFDDPSKVPVINNLILDVMHYKSTPDFIMLREKPFLQTGNHELILLNRHFLSEKLYSSFLFDFARINGMSYGDVKRKIGLSFTEHFVFYSLIHGCFRKQMDVLYSGTELKQILKNGEPDYYMRKGNNIFLLECKDVVINAKTKCSDDVDAIIKALKELFVETTEDKQNQKKLKKTKKKGVLQLLRVISEHLGTILDKIDYLKYETINVFPIIVYQDVSFDVEGVNYFLSEIMRNKISEFNIDEKYHLQDLAMIPMYELVLYEDFFSDNKISIQQVLQDFILYRNKGGLNAMIPFSKFLGREAQKVGYHSQRTKRFQHCLDRLSYLGKFV